ncbi:MAG: GNAT family N-acetyltransferase [Spirochaetia bacterium]|nr:GNAT family N-acetyltransferase [Spirochaetia bacterium]
MDISKIEFRQLTQKDLPSLLELYVQLDENNKDLTTESSIPIWEEISKNPNIKYFGAVDTANGDRVVSTCFTMIIPNLTAHGRSICFLENVVTDSAYRKQGLARKVIEMAIEDAKSHNCYKVILQSNCKRTEAHKFYENLGFDGNLKKAFDLRVH